MEPSKQFVMDMKESTLLILSALLIIGSYLAGYRRGSRTGSRLTLDFSKKTDLEGKGRIG